MGEKKAGYDCWWPTCDKTVQDEALVRTRPKGEPGEFMCSQHAEQRALEALTDGAWQCETCGVWSRPDRDQCYDCLAYHKDALAPTQPGAPRTETANERKTDGE